MKDRAQRNPRSLVRLTLAAALSLGCFALTLIGCGNGAADYCHNARNCERGNDADEKACNERYDEGSQIADLRNCSSEFDDYQNCLQDNSRCKDHSFSPQDDKLCQSQKDRLNSCLK